MTTTAPGAAAAQRLTDEAAAWLEHHHHYAAALTLTQRPLRDSNRALLARARAVAAERMGHPGSIRQVQA